MSNPSKAKGSAFESRILAHLRASGLEATRQPAAGREDVGDLHVRLDRLFGLVIECKCQREQSLAEWVDEATAEAANAERRGCMFGALPITVHSRRMRPVGQQYVTLSLDTLIRLLRTYASEAFAE